MVAYVSNEGPPAGLRGVHSLGLPDIRSLTMVDTRVEHIREEGFHTCFSAFRETLTFLFLEFYSTSFSALVTLVGYFPNLTARGFRPEIG